MMRVTTTTVLWFALSLSVGARAAQAPVAVPVAPAPRSISAGDCTAAKLGTSIPTSSIGEPVAGVTLDAPRWVEASGATPAYCAVDGHMAPVDSSASARVINFRVLLPSNWSGRAAQIGGGGNNGIIPDLVGGLHRYDGATPTERGMAAYGSDSGHQMTPRGEQPPPGADDWATNDEAIRNLAFMQMKKTHDAAMVVIERMYGARPRFNYYLGSSQGGREGLTVAQRYPADYDGIVANVPIVNFSSLMLAPEWIRIQEKPAVAWVTPAKVNAIRGEFMRQCDGLDGLADGVINNYRACRAIFDVTQGEPGRHPWAAKRCPGNIDPNPADTSPNACLTEGQVATLEFVYRRYRFANPLANGVTSFGMWVPNTDPSGSGLIVDRRFLGQEGAAPDAPTHTHLGVLGVTGYLMRNLKANPLDYVEGGALEPRRQELSRWLDATNPDLSAFARRGGRIIVTIGTNDTLASPGAQLDYYQSLQDTMGTASVDAFARLFVLPQTNHGLQGTAYSTTGEGKATSGAAIPNTYDRLTALIAWVEQQQAPGKTLTVTAGDRSLPLCSYPTYPRYVEGPENLATSYVCAP